MSRDNEDEMPTPRLSGSFQTFRDVALELARRLDNAALFCSKNPLHLDLAVAMKALDLAAQARVWSEIFARWPDNPPSVEERSASIEGLLEFRLKAEALLGRLPRKI